MFGRISQSRRFSPCRTRSDHLYSKATKVLAENASSTRPRCYLSSLRPIFESAANLERKSADNLYSGHRSVSPISKPYPRRRAQTDSLILSSSWLRFHNNVPLTFPTIHCPASIFYSWLKHLQGITRSPCHLSLALSLSLTEPACQSAIDAF